MEIELTVQSPPTPPVPAVPPPSYTAIYHHAGLVLEITSAAPYGLRHVTMRVRATDGCVSPTMNLLVWTPIPSMLFEKNLAEFLASFVDAVDAREAARWPAVGVEADRG